SASGRQETSGRPSPKAIEPRSSVSFHVPPVRRPRWETSCFPYRAGRSVGTRASLALTTIALPAPSGPFRNPCRRWCTYPHTLDLGDVPACDNHVGPTIVLACRPLRDGTAKQKDDVMTDATKPGVHDAAGRGTPYRRVRTA